MEDEKQLEILLDDPKPAEEKKDEPVVVVEGEEPQVAAQNDDGDPVAALKKMEEKLKREKKKAEKSERERERAEQIAQQAMAEAGENRKHVMMAALNQVKMDTDRLMTEYAEAMSINNFDEAAKIQAAMSQNAVRSAQFEAEINNLKRQEAPQIGSQIDQIIKSVSPESSRWLKQHRDHLDDPVMIQDMFDAHNAAIRRAIKPDSDEYFEFIEKRLGIGEEQKEEAPRKRVRDEDNDDEPLSAAAKPAPKQAPPPPAPVERYSNRPNVIRLSRAEAETAKMLGMTEKEYAMNKLALQKEGKLPN